MIDVKEWAKRFHLMRASHPPIATLDQFADCVQFHVDLIRAVIAEQTPQIADAVLKCRVDADYVKPAEAQGKSPEKGAEKIGNPLWNAFLDALSAAFDDGATWQKTDGRGHEGYVSVANKAWPELTRRVEQATAELAEKLGEAGGALFRSQQESAEKDKRIAELEKQLAVMESLAVNNGISAVTLHGEHFDKLKQRIAELEAETKKFNDYSVNVELELQKIDNLVSDAVDWRKVGHENVTPRVWRVRNLKQQLAERDAECARLKKVADDIDEKFIKEVAISDKLREQLAAATKPVEDVKVGSAATFHPELWVVSHGHFQLELAARVAAERKLAELREFCKTKCYSAEYGSLWDRQPAATDERLDKTLAAFRAEKGKVA